MVLIAYGVKNKRPHLLHAVAILLKIRQIS